MKRVFIVAASALMLAACTDLTPLEEKISELEGRVESIEEAIASINSDIQLLNEITSGMQLTGAFCEDGVWNVKFANGNSYKIAVGGAKGNAPVMSINIDLMVEANKVEQDVEVSSRSTAVTLFVNGKGNWSFTAEGKTSEIKDAAGHPVTAVVEVSDGYFSSVSVKDGICTLTLKTGDVYTIGIQPEYHMYIVGASGTQEFMEGETRSYELDLLNIVDISISTPSNFTAEITDDVLVVKAVVTKVTIPDPASTITLTGISDDGRACIARMAVLSVKASYHDDFNAGNFRIDGVSYDDFTPVLVQSDMVIAPGNAADYSGKILFIEDNATLTIEAGTYLQNVIIVGDNRAKKTRVVMAGAKPDHRIGPADAVIAFKNVDIDAGTCNATMSWIGSSQNLKAFVFDSCVIRTAVPVNASAGGGYEKFAVVGCDIFIPAGTDDLCFISNGGTTAKQVHIENNLVACPDKCAFTFVRDNSKSADMQSVNISYNSFIGIRSVGLNSGLVQGKSVSDNITFTANLFQNSDVSGSGNIAGVSLADTFKGSLSSENNYRCFVEGVLDLYHNSVQGNWFTSYNASNTNPTKLYTSVNFTTGVFEKNPVVKSFGAQR